MIRLVATLPGLFSLAVAASVLGVAAIAKTRNLDEFEDSLSYFVQRGPVSYWLIARLIIAMELGTVVALLIAPTIGFVVSAVMFLAFAGVLWRAKVRRTNAYCLCFGRRGGLIGMRHIARALALSGVSFIGLIPSSASLDVRTVPPILVGALVVGTVIVVAGEGPPIRDRQLSGEQP